MGTTTSKRQGCLRWGIIILGGLVLLINILILVGCLSQAQAERADFEQYPAPGELITVNGRQMHLYCQGEGSPTVILDAGQGGWSTDMQPLADELSDTNHVCTYDRAGYGWSDPADDQRTPQDLADDLAALLSAAEVPPPYVVVAFSHTGLSSRIYAAQHREEVAGLVLIDPATEYDNDILGDELVSQQRSFAGSFQLFETLARIGVVRFLDPREMAGSAPYFVTPDLAPNPDLYYAFVSHPKWWRTSYLEFVSRLDHLDQVRENGQFGDTPVVIIAAEYVGGADDSLNELQEARIHTLGEMILGAERGEFILAEGASHNVIFEQPELVIEAIENLIASLE